MLILDYFSAHSTPSKKKKAQVKYEDDLEELEVKPRSSRCALVLLFFSFRCSDLCAANLPPPSSLSSRKSPLSILRMLTQSRWPNAHPPPPRRAPKRSLPHLHLTSRAKCRLFRESFIFLILSFILTIISIRARRYSDVPSGAKKPRVSKVESEADEPPSPTP